VERWFQRGEGEKRFLDFKRRRRKKWNWSMLGERNETLKRKGVA